MKDKINVGDLILVVYDDFTWSFLQRITSIEEEKFNAETVVWISLRDLRISDKPSIYNSTYYFNSLMTSHIYTLNELSKLLIDTRKRTKEKFFKEFSKIRMFFKNEKYFIKRYIFLPQMIRELRKIINSAKEYYNE